MSDDAGLPVTFEPSPVGPHDFSPAGKDHRLGFRREWRPRSTTVDAEYLTTAELRELHATIRRYLSVADGPGPSVYRARTLISGGWRYSESRVRPAAMLGLPQALYPKGSRERADYAASRGFACERLDLAAGTWLDCTSEFL